ncbi:hypothetical protein ACSFA8_19505 [Variovorax sp. RT4R15]|uniref:hypothetical protein n=1 Tax=Variovorax sp. RT4R15 TaxID=3443737 RepID=UPI003F4799A3
MTLYLRRIFCVLLCLPAWVLASEPTEFTAALRATTVGGNAADAFFLVGLLRSAGAPAAEVEALRRELLHAYLARITDPAAPPAPQPGAWESLKRRLPGMTSPPKDTVAAAIARGHSRSGVLEAPFRAAWQGALNQGLTPRWETGAARTPFFAISMRDMQAIAPGLWAAPGAGGKVHLKLALRLANTSTQPLPVFRPDVILGGAPGTGLGGLAFACTWDHPEHNLSVMQANTVTMLQPGEASAPLACETPPAPMYWRDQLPALTAAGAAAKPLLVPHDLDSAQRLHHLELALAELAPQAEDWSRRLLTARQEPARQWAPGASPLEPPVSSRWAARPHQGWETSAAALKYFLGGTMLALALFAGGRGLLHAGMPKFAVAGVTLLAGAGLAVLATASLGGGDTGYSHPLYTGIALWSAFGPVLLCVLALHGLQKLLDNEQIDWWDAVAKGWRSTLNLTSATSRAEFWCFLAHCAWLWALARICLAPLDRWIGLALMVPVLTLTVRRLRSMSGTEVLEMGLSAACLVLLVIL